MTKHHVACLVAIFALTITEAKGQQVARFRNQMQAQARVTLTPVGGQALPPFEIFVDRDTEFEFGPGQRFDIQVIPVDQQQAGFRFQNVDLVQLANEAGVIALDGIFAPGPKRRVCYTTGCLFKRCRCYWKPTRGERIAVVLNARLRSGQMFEMHSPLMPYDQLIGARSPSMRIGYRDIALRR